MSEADEGKTRSARQRSCAPAGRAFAWLPIALVLLALALRLWQLDAHPFWFDERLELERAGADLRTLLFGRPIDQDPPLGALVWRLWMALGGGPGHPLATSEFWMRLPGALLGAITVALAYAWAGRRFGRRRAALFALLLAIAPVSVHYAQELNQYAAVPLLTLLILIAWEGVVLRGRPADWRRLTLVSALCLLWHYSLAFMVGGTCVDLAWRAWGRRDTMLTQTSRAPGTSRTSGTSGASWTSRISRTSWDSWTSRDSASSPLLRHTLWLGMILALLLWLGLADRAATPHLDQRLFGTSPIKELDYLVDRLWREMVVFFALPFSGGPALVGAGAIGILAALGARWMWRDSRGRIDGVSGRCLLVVGFLLPLALGYPADILGLYPLGFRWLLHLLPLYLLALATALDALWRKATGLGRLATGLVVLNLLLFLPQQDGWNGWMAVPREETVAVSLESRFPQLRDGDIYQGTCNKEAADRIERFDPFLCGRKIDAIQPERPHDDAQRPNRSDAESRSPPTNG
jgi:hypothetical protein